MNVKFDWQWPGAIVFMMVFCCLSFLVYNEKIPSLVLTGLLAWLVPSPIQIPAAKTVEP